MDQKKLEQAARLIIEAVGEDPKREGLLETPRRFAEMVAEQLAYAAALLGETAQAARAQAKTEQKLYRALGMAGGAAAALLVV